MVFGWLKPGRLSLAWRLAPSPQPGGYRPGETVRAVLQVAAPEKKVKLRRLRVGVVFWQRYRQWVKREECYETPPEGYDLHPDCELEEGWVEKTHWVVAGDLNIPKPVPKGFRHTYHLTFRLPPQLPPPHQARLCQAGWYMKAQADRPLATDTVAMVDMPLVVPPPGVAVQPGWYGQATHPREVDMRLRLPKAEFVEGETVEGELHLRAHKAIQARALQVRLVVREEVPQDAPFVEFPDDQQQPFWELYTVAQTTLAEPVALAPGQQQVYPFRLTIPQAQRPTCDACGAHGTIRWQLQGVLDIPRGRDRRVDATIWVANGR